MASSCQEMIVTVTFDDNSEMILNKKTLTGCSNVFEHILVFAEIEDDEIKIHVSDAKLSDFRMAIDLHYDPLSTVKGINL